MSVTTLESITSLETPEALFAPPGMDAKMQRDDMIETYPGYTKGSRQVIPYSMAEMYTYIRTQKDYWENQLELCKNKLRWELADKEWAVTVDGTKIAQRRRFWKNTYEVTGHYEDAIYPSRG